MLPIRHQTLQVPQRSTAVSGHKPYSNAGSSAQVHFTLSVFQHISQLRIDSYGISELGITNSFIMKHETAAAFSCKDLPLYFRGRKFAMLILRGGASILTCCNRSHVTVQLLSLPLVVIKPGSELPLRIIFSSLRHPTDVAKPFIHSSGQMLSDAEPAHP